MSGINIQQLMFLISPDGLSQMQTIIETAQRERGAGWIDELSKTYPLFPWIYDLIANHTAEDAFNKLQSEYSHLPLFLWRAKILDAHNFLKTIIERKF